MDADTLFESQPAQQPSPEALGEPLKRIRDEDEEQDFEATFNELSMALQDSDSDDDKRSKTKPSARAKGKRPKARAAIQRSASPFSDESEDEDPAFRAALTTEMAAAVQVAGPSAASDDDDDDDDDSEGDEAAEDSDGPQSRRLARRRPAGQRTQQAAQPRRERRGGSAAAKKQAKTVLQPTEQQAAALQAWASEARLSGDTRLALSREAVDPLVDGGARGWQVARTLLPAGRAVMVSGRSSGAAASTEVRVRSGGASDGALASALLTRVVVRGAGATVQRCRVQLLRAEPGPDEPAAASAPHTTAETEVEPASSSSSSSSSSAAWGRASGAADAGATPTMLGAGAAWAVWQTWGGGRGNAGRLTVLGRGIEGRAAALKLFRRLFRSRTGQDWTAVLRGGFTAIPGKYAVASTDQEAPNHSAADSAAAVPSASLMEDGTREAQVCDPAAAELLGNAASDAVSSSGGLHGLGVRRRGVRWSGLGRRAMVEALAGRLADLETAVTEAASKAKQSDGDDDDDEEDDDGDKRGGGVAAVLRAESSPEITRLAAELTAHLPIAALQPRSRSKADRARGVEENEGVEAIATSLSTVARSTRLLLRFAAVACVRPAASAALAAAASTHPADSLAHVLIAAQPGADALTPLEHAPHDAAQLAALLSVSSASTEASAASLRPLVLRRAFRCPWSPPVRPPSDNRRILWRICRRAELPVALCPASWWLPQQLPLCALPFGRAFAFFQTPTLALRAALEEEGETASAEGKVAGSSSLVLVGYDVDCGREAVCTAPRFMLRPPSGYQTVVAAGSAGAVLPSGQLPDGAFACWPGAPVRSSPLHAAVEQDLLDSEDASTRASSTARFLVFDAALARPRFVVTVK